MLCFKYNEYDEAMSPVLDTLNDRQREAVTAPLGSTLVLAGAGSGKTRVLVSRVVWLVQEQQIPLHAILAVTFTNKAAGEMKSRLSQLLSVPLGGLWVGTFHGLCHRILRRHATEAHLPEQFQILDSDDQLRTLKRVIASLNLEESRWPAKQAQSFINSHKDEGIRPHKIVQQQWQYGPTRTLIQIYTAYEKACAIAGVIDFAELILRTYELLRDDADILAHYQGRFQAILVDEFQDTNAIQYAWIRLLAGDSSAITVVGDDDQSIYGWRGAKVENIHRFSNDFPDTHIIRLEQNYRSTEMILRAANALIDHNTARMGKELWTKENAGEKIVVYKAFNELDEARFIVERIQLLIDKGHTASQIAILYRSNVQSRVIEEALLRYGIAYRIYGGVRFFERSEIKDALAYLRLIMNHNDDASFERIVNFPNRGIGEKTLETLRNAAKNESISLWQAGERLLQNEGFSARSAKALGEFTQLIEQLTLKVADLPLEKQVETVIHQSGIYSHYQHAKEERAESRIENLQELVGAAKQFIIDPESDMPTLLAFLSHASMEAGEMQANEYDDFVQLMTFHAAKGLEFPFVFMVGIEEGVFPSRQSVDDPAKLEEERRLCYVGMTRAMQGLFLTYAEIRRLYGREEFHRPSRFLREIPEECTESIGIKAQYSTINPIPNKFSPRISEEIQGYKLGQAVHHGKFGTGVIVGFEGSGEHQRVQVNFTANGVKWLVLAYANLT